MQLSDVIAQVESGTSDAAARFEFGLYAEWGVAASDPERQKARDQITATIAALHRCNRNTAHMLACTSWGRYQLLGENIYSLCECKLPVAHFVVDPDFQRLCFDEFLHKRGIAFTLDEIVADADKRQKFISAYNGPAAVDAYWSRMQAAMVALGGATPRA